MTALLVSVVLALLPSFTSPREPVASERIPVLIVTGENNHDWRWTSTKMRQVLHDSGKFQVEVSIYPSGFMMDRYELEKFPVILLDYNGQRWGEAAEKNFLEVVEQGTGVVVVHAANNAFPGWTEYEKLVGNLWREGTSHGRFHAFDVRIDNEEHPVTKGFPPMKAHADELYHKLVDVTGSNYEVLATAYSDPATGGTGEREPVMFAGQYGKGRIFHTPLGHVWYGDRSTWASHGDEQFQHLLIRAVEWAATGKVTALSRLAPNTLSAADRAAGWKLLFDGATPAGWKSFQGEGFPEDHWKVENGCLKVLTEDGGHLVHNEIHDDFELELEWRVSEGADAGIFLRVGDQGDEPSHTGMGYDLSHGSDDTLTPGLVGGAERILRPVGEFNHVRIVAHDRIVEHWLNGIKIMTLNMSTTQWADAVSSSKFKDYPNYSRLPIGRIALSGGTDVLFRNIKIREIAHEAGVHEASGPTDLFNGTDLSGWTPWTLANNNAIVFEAKEGDLVCNGLETAYLATNKSYQDFTLEFDWRYPPTTRQAGNGALLLRGVPWNDSIRGIAIGLQSLYVGDLWSYEGFPVQADRNRTQGNQIVKLADAENRPGEWSHVVAKVKGDRITVHMNGTLVNEARGLEVVPGKIAILSKGNEVHYRNLKLTPAE